MKFDPKHLLKALDKSDNEIYVFGQDLKFQYVNKGARQNLRYTQQELLKLTPVDIKPEYPEEKFNQIIAPLLKGKKSSINFKTWHKRKDKSLYPVEVRLEYDRESSLFTAIILDLTETQLLEKEAVLKNNIVDQSDDAIVTKDLNSIVTSWNKGAEKIFGYKAAEMIGKSITVIIPEERIAEEDMILSTIKSGKIIDHFETKRVTKSGKVIDISVTISPISVEGKIVGASKIAREITHQKKVQLDNEQTLLKLKLAQKASKFGVWTWDIEKDEFTWDNQMYLIHEVDKETQITDKIWEELIHPDDRQEVNKNAENASATRLPQDHIYKIVTPKGNLRYIRSISTFNKSKGGHHQFVGINWDITNILQNELKLEKTNAKLEQVLKASQHGYWVLDLEKEELECSDLWWEILGLKPKNTKLPMDYWREFVHLDDRQKIDQAHKKALESENWFEVESRRKHKKGHYIWVLVKGVVTRNKDGKPISMSGTITDITKRKEHELLLAESEERYRFLVEKSGDGLIIIDKNKVSYASPANEKMWDMPREKIVGMSTADLIGLVHKDDIARISSDISNALNNRHPEIKYIYKLQTPSGKIICMEDIVQLFYNESGEMERALVRGRDVTEREQMISKLKEAEETLSKFFESPGAGRAVVTLEKNDIKHLIANKQIARFFNVPHAKMDHALSGEDLNLPPEDVKYWRNQFIQSKRKNRPVSFEYRYTTHLGDVLHLLCTVNYIGEKLNSPRYTYISYDITKLKNTEESLRALRDNYQDLIENSPLPIVIHKAGEIMYANNNSGELFEYNKASDLIGENLKFYFPEGDSILDKNKKVSDLTEEHTFKDSKSQKKTVTVNSSSVRYENTDAVLTIFNDITKEKESLEKLRHNEAMLSSITNNIPGIVLVYVLKPDGSDEIRYVSQGAEDIWELQKSEILKDPNNVWRLTYPDDLPEFKKSVELSAKGLSTWQYEYRIVTKSGQTKWLSALGEPNKLPDGSVLWYTLLLEVTERKEIELRNAELVQDLGKALDEKDLLFRELHHRVKNNLQLINSLLFVKSYSDTSEELKEFILDTTGRINSISKIHEYLLAANSIDTINAKEYTDELVKSLIQAHGKNEYKTDLKIESIMLNVDEMMKIGLIINELVLNIFKHAYPDQRKGKVILRLFLKDELNLIVKDNGEGIKTDKILRESFGMQMIDLMAEELNGTYEILSNNGTSYHFKFNSQKKNIDS